MTEPVNPGKDDRGFMNARDDQAQFLAPVIHSDEICADKDWAKIFGNRNPLKLDIGCGNGSFLVEMAIAEPHCNFIGIDFYAEGIRRTCRKIMRNQLSNARVLHASAKRTLELCFADESVAAIYVNFPDPWPKRRHGKRRMVQSDFAKLLYRRLQIGGEIVLATDSETYLGEMLGVLTAVKGLESKYASGIVNSLPNRIETLYERRYRERGMPIFYAGVQKTK